MAKRFHVERHIDAPPARVWDLLTDASSYTRWNPAIVSIKGDMSLGSTVTLVSTVNPKRTFALTVSEYTPPSKMVWSDRMTLGLFVGERTFVLAERDGGTLFAMTEEFSGPLSGLITKMIPDMTESFEQFADGLAREAETS